MKAYCLRAKKKSGFTLVELMIVVAIIGIIAGSMVVKFNAKTDKATTTMNLSSLRSLDKAAESYIAEGLVTTTAVTGDVAVWGGTTSHWMTAAERTALVTSLARAGKITPEGSAALEAARFRAYVTANGGGTAPVAVTIMQYQHSATDPYVVNGNKTCSAAFMADAVVLTAGTDYSGFGTPTSWEVALQ